MKKKMLLRQIYLFLLLVLNIFSFSQISKEEVFKKYTLIDSISKNDAILVLYKNGTFINFGLICNEKEKEWYIWLTSGNYLTLPDKFILNSTLEVDKMNPLLNNIKNHYKYRSDHALIVNGFEYQLETYKDLSLIMNNDKLKDFSKKIEYIGVK